MNIHDALAQLGPSISRLLTKTICLLLDDRGDVLDSLCPGDFQFRSVHDQIKGMGNVRAMFRLREIAGKAGAGEICYAHLPDVRLDEVIEPVYTTHPVLIMKVFPARKGLFIGLVQISGIVPVHFEHSSGTLLYIDDRDGLAGFYHSFFEHFGKGFGKPEEMLGLSVDRFFSPTPLEIQKNYLQSATRERGVYAPHFRKDFGPGDGWPAQGPHGSVFTVEEALDFPQNDVRVAVEFESPPGRGPLVIFGDKGETRSGFLDDNGYSIGPAPEGNRIVIKRRGMNIAVFPLESAPGNPQSLDVRKTGQGFEIRGPGHGPFFHRDLDFLEREKVHVSLFLRKGDACRLKRLSVEKRGHVTVSTNNSVVVRGNNGNSYLLNVFYSNYLTSQSRPVYGYRLQDITDFQRRVRDLEAQREKHIRAETELRGLLEKVQKEKSVFVGGSREITILREKAGRIAASPTTVLLQGATGTGKEVLARYIHDNSLHAQGPFVKIDCSTLPRTLMESELFGYEAGAFTGAQKRKTGLLEQANKGTLFLDELGNLTPDAQVKLLQFLQDQTLTRVGGSAAVKVNTRVIAASNQDLEQMVKQGLFREDLYYRIAVVAFFIPPLKDRMDDLAGLAHHFLEQFGRSYNKSITGFSPLAMKKLYACAWPGNIRELRNAVEQAVLFCDGKEIQPEHLAVRAEGQAALAAEPADKRCKITLSAEETKDLLKEHHGRINKAARAIGVTRRALYYYMEKLGINPNDFRRKPHQRRQKR